MTNSRGNTRFKGGGSLWKSSWKGSVLNTEMCCLDGFESVAFGDPPVERWYEGAVGLLPIVPANGFLFGAVVQVSEPPVPNAVPIAQNTDGSTAGWRMEMLDASPSADDPRVSFRFTMYGAAGVVGQVVSDEVLLSAVVPGFGLPPAITIRVLVAVSPPSGGVPNGLLTIIPRSTFGIGPSSVALSAPYAGGNSPFYLGARGPGVSSAFQSPNCIHGVVAAEAPLPLDGLASINAIYDAWTALIDVSYQIEPLPTADVLVPVTNLVGWRADPPAGLAPSTLVPFVGTDELTLVNSQAGTLDMNVECRAPTEFELGYLALLT